MTDPDPPPGGDVHDGVLYPWDDGLPLADSARQYDWIARLRENLEHLLEGLAFVGVNLLWYPVEGDPEVRVAPDVMVIFGAGSRARDSYLQWMEPDRIAPQVVFEVLSHSHTPEEMSEKLAFYDAHGVEEYYVIDCQPLAEGPRHVGYIRGDGGLAEQPLDGWASPRLSLRFAFVDPDIDETGIVVQDLDGNPLKRLDAKLGEHVNRQTAELPRLRERLREREDD